MTWDDAAFAQAAALRATGLTWSVIAGRMGTTRNGVVCAFLRAGIPLPQVPADVQRRYAPRVKPTAKSKDARERRKTIVGKPASWAYDLGERLWCSVPGCWRSPHPKDRMCLGHIVLDKHENYKVKLTLLSESTTPRRLAEAIRDRIETRGWTTRQWAEMVGLPPSTANKAVRHPDQHPKSFAKIADYFGFLLDPRTGTYRRKPQASSVA